MLFFPFFHCFTQVHNRATIVFRCAHYGHHYHGRCHQRCHRCACSGGGADITRCHRQSILTPAPPPASVSSGTVSPSSFLFSMDSARISPASMSRYGIKTTPRQTTSQVHTTLRLSQGHAFLHKVGRKTNGAQYTYWATVVAREPRPPPKVTKSANHTIAITNLALHPSCGVPSLLIMSPQSHKTHLKRLTKQFCFLLCVFNCVLASLSASLRKRTNRCTTRISECAVKKAMELQSSSSEGKQLN